MKDFEHPAQKCEGNRKLVYSAISKHYFYFRMHISRYILEQGAVPLNPFMLFDYFLLDTIERDDVREANNTVVLRADEIWVFGPISNGVLAEIQLAQKANKPLKYFAIIKSHHIEPISPTDIEMEEEVKSFRELLICTESGGD